MTHLEKIAHDLEYTTYKDPVHGKIAKLNFEYGVAQARLEAERNSKISLVALAADILEGIGAGLPSWCYEAMEKKTRREIADIVIKRINDKRIKDE